MLLPEHMDIHPHLLSEAKAATMTRWLCTQGDSQGLFSLPSGCSEGPWPSLQGRGYISSLHNAQDQMPCHAQHATPRRNTHNGKTAHGGRAHLW